jgi:trimeric autotransporter adhesin
MATNVKFKRSAIEGKRPSISQLELGELALNTNDGRVFTRKYNVGIGSTVTLLNVWTENIGGGAYYTEGNIGVGTTNPTAKFEVSGTVKATDFDSLSDKNLKQNIKPIDSALEKIISINGVSFEWKCNQEPSIGVIAQEVENIFPELVNTEKYKSVNYNGLVGVLIAAVKELNAEVSELRAQINNNNLGENL